MSQMIGQAIEENNEKLSQDISRMVNDKVLKEIDYLMRVADERDEGAVSAAGRDDPSVPERGKRPGGGGRLKNPVFPAGVPSEKEVREEWKQAVKTDKRRKRKGNKNSSNPRKRKTLGGLEEGIDRLITMQRTRRSAFECSGTGFHGRSSAFCLWRQERPAGSGRRYRC